MENEKKEVGIWDANPKITFVLGLVAGIATMSLIVLLVVIQMVFSGKMYSLNNDSVGNGTNKQVVQKQPEKKAPAAPLAKVDEKRDHVLGPKDAKVTLVVYSDFECPYCARHYDTIKALEKKYKGKIRIVFRQFPLGFHQHAQKAAEASECAADQGKFWEMHDKLFELNKAKGMGIDAFKQAAKDLGLNTDKFNKCLDSSEKVNRVAEDSKTGSASGVSGTPATFVNGKMLSGALPVASFSQIIDSALK